MKTMKKMNRTRKPIAAAPKIRDVTKDMNEYEQIEFGYVMTDLYDYFKKKPVPESPFCRLYECEYCINRSEFMLNYENPCMRTADEEDYEEQEEESRKFIEKIEEITHFFRNKFPRYSIDNDLDGDECPIGATITFYPNFDIDDYADDEVYQESREPGMKDWTVYVKTEFTNTYTVKAPSLQEANRIASERAIDDLDHQNDGECHGWDWSGDVEVTGVD